ncbi:hypothetical protein BCAR13_120101 [Paraburkholderia caribensis]|nr:hypothetical protein BCAR13_120101 [Paraburkholderia caribensis]
MERARTFPPGRGMGMVRIVTGLRTRFGEAVGLEGFLAIGLMGLCYGCRFACAHIRIRRGVRGRCRAAP